MKEVFIDKDFGIDSILMLRKINAILNDYQKQGYDLSLRQLYYQLVSQNVIENTEKSYKKLGVLVSDARMAGYIDWDMIKDRGREMQSNPHWKDPKDFMEVVAPQYRFDLWHDQPCYVEVMVEKQALEGVLIPECQKLDIPFTANKGYSSSSALYEASKRFLKAKQAGKELHIVYLGDHDPSGIDMSRDVLDRLDLLIKTSYNSEVDRWEYRIGPNEAEILEVHRVALNMDQIKTLRPPENPAKITDPRAGEYISRFGRKSWELDAIEPRQLAKLVNDAVTGIMDVGKFNKNVRKMNKERAMLLKFAKTLKE